MIHADIKTKIYRPEDIKKKEEKDKRMRDAEAYMEYLNIPRLGKKHDK